MSDALTDFEGTVFPAFLDNKPRQNLPNMLPLRFGRVIRAYKPGETEPRNTNFTEYDVLVEEGSEDRAVTRFVLPRCLAMSAFGGVADFSRWTPRVAENFADTKDFGLGSRVLVLCINGSAYKGIIIGGVQNAGNSAATKVGAVEKDSKDLGHHATLQFNGIRFEVNNDGELNITFKGATNPDNSLTESADPEASGTTLQITKDGNFKVFTKDDKQHILIDHANKVIDVLADTDWKVLSNGTFNLESKKDTNLVIGGQCSTQAQKDVIVKSATGTYSLEAMGALTFTTNTAGVTVNANVGTVRINSLGVYCGAAAVDAFIKGTTYRLSETAMHTAMMAALATLSAAGGAVAGAGGALSGAGGAMAIPVAGAIAAGPIISGAGAALTTAGGLITGAAAALTAAISAFEAATVSYLSLKNFTD